jgi:serine/threonine protein kinase/Tfp pilus assembly protein PilF
MMTQEQPTTLDRSAREDAPPANDRPTDPPGFELLEEIGRGGMGVIYRARDIALARDVAIKVLQARFPSNGTVAQRFLSEARITGQLQHPGIPGIHLVGSLPNVYPFLAMKLIKGHTLDEILKSRPNLVAERGRLVAVFEAVCQAVGYAHAHGVIHRDLKPANVMVGAFGEVQVMDWGLAKVLEAAPGASPEAAAGNSETQALTEVADPRSGSQEGSYTEAGSLLGTPAYAPPEQAAGDVARVDRRADVFGLGALLAVILTGKPPYVAARAEAVRLMSMLGELEGCFARLDGCGAEPELVALCKRCLALEPAARPADAGAVATAVAGLRAAAEERAKQAEFDRVRAEGDRKAVELQAAEERKRRKVLVALAATVGLLLLGGGGFLWWQDRQANRQRAERAMKAQQTRDSVIPLIALAADLWNQAQYQEASAAIDRAAQLLNGGEADDLLLQIDQARTDLAFVRDLDVIFSISYKARHTNEIRWLVDPLVTPKQYRDAFLGRGFDFRNGDIDDLARRLAESEIRAQLIDALDFWAVYEPDQRLAKQLLAVLRKVDPGPWLDRLRDPAVRGDPAKLLALIRDADAVRTPPARISILFSLGEVKEADAAATAAAPAEISTLLALRQDHRRLTLSKLLESQLHEPTNFRINYALGGAFYVLAQYARAEGFFRAAVAVRPTNSAAVHGLGISIMQTGDPVRAVPVLRRAVALNPSAPDARNSFAWALRSIGETDEAMKVLREGIKRMPHAPALIRHLGWVLCQIKMDYNTGIPLLRKAVKLAPADAQNHDELGWCLLEGGKPREALPYLKKAVELAQKWPHPRIMLAQALKQTGDEQGAKEQLRIAVALDKRPQSALAIGSELLNKGDYDAAIPALKQAVEQQPNNAIAQYNIALCYILRSKGWETRGFNLAAVNQSDITEAITHLQKAISIANTFSLARGNLGWCLFLKGRLDDALAELERAAKIAPTSGWIRDRLEFVKKAKAAHSAGPGNPRPSR